MEATEESNLPFICA